MTQRARELDQRKAAQAGAACACFNLRKAARAVTQLYDETLRPSGLRATQGTLLMVLRARGEMTVTDLADVVVMDRTTLTRNLKLLEKKRFIRIQPGDDRRVRMVSLTLRGREVLAEGYRLWEQVQTRVAKGLGQERMSQLLSDLSAVVSVARSA